MTEAENVVLDEPAAASDAELDSNYTKVTGGKRRRKGSKKKRRGSSKSSSKSSRKGSRKGTRKGSKKRGPSKWIAHVKAYCKQHNMTFPEALKDPNCGKAFRR